MRYLKTFENKEITFKTGDLVKIDNKLNINNWKLYEFLMNNVGVFNDSSVSYYFINYTDVPNDITNNFIKRDENLYELAILKNYVRLATLEEIESYNMKQNAKKYNL